MARIARWALALILAQAASSASAQPGPLELELNRLEPLEAGCRVYFVFGNRTGYAFDAFTLDLVLFGTDAVIAKRMTIDAAPLPADKTTVKLFDITDMACADIGRMLLNTVVDCVDRTGARHDCTALVEPTSRAAVDLVK